MPEALKSDVSQMGAPSGPWVGRGARSARLKPCGPLPAPPYSPIKDGGDERTKLVHPPCAKRGEVSPEATEGPRGSAENAARTLANVSLVSRRAAIAVLVGLAPLGAHAAAPPVVTLLGDSITAGLGLTSAGALPAQLQLALAHLGVSAIVRGAGVSGDTSAGGLARLDFSVQPDTAVCVVELGANDYLQSIDPRETAANLDRIVERLKARGIAVVLVGGTAPAHSSGDYGRAFDALFPKIAAARHVILAPDLLAGVAGKPALRQADGLHPNAVGVQIMAARLAPAVARALKPRLNSH